MIKGQAGTSYLSSWQGEQTASGSTGLPHFQQKLEIFTFGL